MLKKTITYVDYDGNSRTEDFYFNLTKAEVIEMEYGVEGGMQKMLERIVAENNTMRLMENFKKIIVKSYGIKSPDGKRFIKNEEVLNAFVESEAYSELFVELATNAKVATEFINGILPKVEEPVVAKQ